MYGVQGQKIPGLNLLSEAQQGRPNHLMLSASGGNDDVPRKNPSTPFVDVTLDTQRGAHQVTLINTPLVLSDRSVIYEEELSRFQRKRKVSASHNTNTFYHYRVDVHDLSYFQNEEARLQWELEVQEKRIRKELVKQDILRQKVLSRAGLHLFFPR